VQVERNKQWSVSDSQETSLSVVETTTTASLKNNTHRTFHTTVPLTSTNGSSRLCLV